METSLKFWRRLGIVALIMAALAGVAIVCSLPPSSPLVMVSSNARFIGISAKCTFGTKHRYFFGGLVGRDHGWRGQWHYYTSWLRASTPALSTVVWVRLRDPAFASSTPAFLIPMTAGMAD